jgi:endonuclease I
MIRTLRVKLYILFILSAIGFSSLAQTSVEQYYVNAEGKSGEELKTALHNIIKTQKVLPYTSSSFDVWDALKQTDEDPANSNNVILLYTGRSDSKSNTDHGQGDPNSWNREHVWAKSHGFGGDPRQNPGAATDIHALRPADRSVNSDRSNKFFDNGGTSHSEATGCKYDSDSWEPRDEIKGDVARMIFYMTVRYEGGNGEPDLEMTNDMSLHNDYDPYHGKKETLLEWHKEDPVSDRERYRNNKIYELQENRNPFIDHPEYVNYIWLGESPDGINITSKIPLNNASNVEVNAELEMNFTQTVVAGEGNLIIYNKEDNSVFESISISNTSLVTFDDKKVKVLPVQNFINGSSYYIKIETNAIKNSEGEYYKGIANDYTWTFSTGQLVLDPLEITARTPMNDAEDVPIDAEITMDFNRAVVAGKNSDGFKIYNSDDGLFEYLSSANSNIDYDDNIISITLSKDLEEGESYYIIIDDNAIKDSNGNYFEGISDKIEWTFTTDQTTDIDDDPFAEKKEPGFYPNPTSGTIYLTSQQKVEKIRIINLTGKTIMEESNQTSLSLSRLPRGMYILTFILNNGEQVSKKLIKK